MHTGWMERDPDYIDPVVLKRRAEASGGAGAVSGRPAVRRVHESDGRISSAGGRGFSIVGGKISTPGVAVTDVDFRVS